MGTFCYKDNFQHGGGMSLGNIAAFGAAVNVALLPALYWLFDPKVGLIAWVGGGSSVYPCTPLSTTTPHPSLPGVLGTEPMQHVHAPLTITHPPPPTPSQVCSVSKTRPIREELADVWAMVQRRSVLLPMLFVGVSKTRQSVGPAPLHRSPKPSPLVITPTIRLTPIPPTQTHHQKQTTALPGLLDPQLGLAALPHPRPQLLRVADRAARPDGRRPRGRRCVGGWIGVCVRVCEPACCPC